MKLKISSSCQLRERRSWKSTTAINLQQCLAEKGKKVPNWYRPQETFTSGFGVDKNGEKKTETGMNFYWECRNERRIDCKRCCWESRTWLIHIIFRAEIEPGIYDKEFIQRESTDKLRRKTGDYDNILGWFYVVTNICWDLSCINCSYTSVY